MGYYAISPKDVENIRAREEDERKGSLVEAVLYAGIALLALLAIVLVSGFGWDARFSILGAITVFWTGASAFICYSAARDAEQRKATAQTKWVDTSDLVSQQR